MQKSQSLLENAINDQVFGEESSIKNATVHFYENLLHDDHPQRSLPDGISYGTIGMEDAFFLVKDFLEEEVTNAINDLRKEKAPGPDGLNIAFFQRCWDVVKGDFF